MTTAEQQLSRHVEPGEPFDVLSYACRIGGAAARQERQQIRHRILHGWQPNYDRLKLAAVKKAHVLEVWLDCGKNTPQAAEVLGVRRATLYDWLKKWGLGLAVLLLLTGCFEEEPKPATLPALPAAALAPQPKQSFLTWDTTAPSFMVYEGPSRAQFTNVYEVRTNRIPLVDGVTYYVAAVYPGQGQSQLAYWPSNRIGRLGLQSSSNLTDWAELQTLETFTNSPTTPRQFLRVVDQTLRWE